MSPLLSNKQSWTWEPVQHDAFVQLKAELAKPTVLAHYCVTAETKISADTSSHGLGALQWGRDNWRPISFASHSMTEKENQYAQKEAFSHHVGMR